VIELFFTIRREIYYDLCNLELETLNVLPPPLPTLVRKMRSTIRIFRKLKIAENTAANTISPPSSHNNNNSYNMYDDRLEI